MTESLGILCFNDVTDSYKTSHRNWGRNFSASSVFSQTVCFPSSVTQYGSTLSDTKIMYQVLLEILTNLGGVNELRLEDGFTLIFGSIYWIVPTVRLNRTAWQLTVTKITIVCISHMEYSHLVFLVLLYTNRIWSQLLYDGVTWHTKENESIINAQYWIFANIWYTDIFQLIFGQ